MATNLQGTLKRPTAGAAGELSSLRCLQGGTERQAVLGVNVGTRDTVGSLLALQLSAAICQCVLYMKFVYLALLLHFGLPPHVCTTDGCGRCISLPVHSCSSPSRNRSRVLRWGPEKGHHGCIAGCMGAWVHGGMGASRVNPQKWKKKPDAPSLHHVVHHQNCTWELLPDKWLVPDFCTFKTIISCLPVMQIPGSTYFKGSLRRAFGLCSQSVNGIVTGVRTRALSSRTKASHMLFMVQIPK